MCLIVELSTWKSHIAVFSVNTLKHSFCDTNFTTSRLFVMANTDITTVYRLNFAELQSQHLAINQIISLLHS
jgi:hypothetical protein